jgi:hypothetical protein
MLDHGATEQEAPGVQRLDELARDVLPRLRRRFALAVELADERLHIGR